MQKGNESIIYTVGNSIFSVLKTTLEPFGFHWKEDKRKTLGGYFEVDMPGTGVEWRSYITKNYWIFIPMDNLPNVRHIHYSFPFPLGIWFHRTIIWEDDRRTHDTLRFRFKAPLTLRKYDMIKDYIVLREKLLKSP